MKTLQVQADAPEYGVMMGDEAQVLSEGTISNRGTKVSIPVYLVRMGDRKVLLPCRLFPEPAPRKRVRLRE